jgi:hypothetical protein
MIDSSVVIMFVVALCVVVGQNNPAIMPLLLAFATLIVALFLFNLKGVLQSVKAVKETKKLEIGCFSKLFYFVVGIVFLAILIFFPESFSYKILDKISGIIFPDPETYNNGNKI